ncbi:hypothetical protein ACF9IK_24760 [Kitasatospora hibisci]|uniref:hypothetical protein n=1 Tax=Kitasatospora hibisci TaxID=3369522 RepID=UPI003753F1BE
MPPGPIAHPQRPGGSERDDGLRSTAAARATAAALPVVRVTSVRLRRDPAPALRELAILIASGPHARVSWRRAR